jgi:hypothetical protein
MVVAGGIYSVDVATPARSGESGTDHVAVVVWAGRESGERAFIAAVVVYDKR